MSITSLPSQPTPDGVADGVIPSARALQCRSGAGFKPLLAVARRRHDPRHAGGRAIRPR
jgi:hypothetical protein